MWAARGSDLVPNQGKVDTTLFRLHCLQGNVGTSCYDICIMHKVPQITNRFQQFVFRSRRVFDGRVYNQQPFGHPYQQFVQAGSTQVRRICLARPTCPVLHSPSFLSAVTQLAH